MEHTREAPLLHTAPEQRFRLPDNHILMPELMYQALFLDDWAHSDIREDLPFLRMYASQCDHVTEFGCRGGTSTVALIAAQPPVVESYDIVACPNEEVIRRALGRTNWKFHLRSSTAGPIAPTDMLFIDSLHTYEHVKNELALHHKKVRKYIAFHDTITCWKIDQFGAEPGIGKAIEEFMAEWHDEWRVRLHSLAQHGFLVLERQSFEEGTVPGLDERVTQKPPRNPFAAGEDE